MRLIGLMRVKGQSATSQRSLVEGGEACRGSGWTMETSVCVLFCDSADWWPNRYYNVLFRLPEELQTQRTQRFNRWDLQQTLKGYITQKLKFHPLSTHCCIAEGSGDIFDFNLDFNFFSPLKTKKQQTIKSPSQMSSIGSVSYIWVMNWCPSSPGTGVSSVSEATFSPADWN